MYTEGDTLENLNIPSGKHDRQTHNVTPLDTMPEAVGAIVVGALSALLPLVSVGQSKIWTLAAPSKHFAEHVIFPTFCCGRGAGFHCVLGCITQSGSEIN